MTKNNFKKMQRYAWVLLACAGLSNGLAQRIPEFLSEDTFFALGLNNLEAAEEQGKAFIEEFQRLELDKTLSEIIQDAFDDSDKADSDEADSDEETSEEMTEDEEFELPEGLTWMDFFGDELWITGSISQYSPIPAITFAAIVSDAEAREIMQKGISNNGNETEEFTEGDYTFYIEIFDAEEDPTFQNMAYAFADDFVVLSSNPDSIRSFLRQLGGSEDPAFTDTENYKATLGAYDEKGFVYTFVDASAITNATKLLSNTPFASTIDRIDAILKTLNTFGTVEYLTKDGVVSETRMLPNAEGGDKLLYKLLHNSVPADLNTAKLAPQNAISYNVTSFDMSQLWAWLNDIAINIPEIDMSLNDIVSNMLNIDLEKDLFSWMDNQWVTITAVPPVVIEPGTAVENFLGDSVYAVKVKKEDKADKNINDLLEKVSNLVSTFSDPSGGEGSANMRPTTLQDIEVNVYEMANGVEVAVAVHNGYLFFSGSEKGLDSVFVSQKDAPNLKEAPAFDRIKEIASENSTTISYNDDKLTTAYAINQVLTQLQTLAGLSGSSNIDFETIETAQADITTFVEFLIPRLDMTVSETHVEDGIIVSISKTDVEW